MKTDLTGKVAVITGANGVICAEMCKALAASGAKVALLGRTYAKVEALANEIGENAFPVACDCVKKEDLLRAREEILNKFGKVDILINGVGGNHPSATTFNERAEEAEEGKKDFFGIDAEGFSFVFDTNLTSAFLATQVFAECMLKTGGNIINISSMNAFRPLTKIPAYSAAKAALQNFTQWLAVHFAGKGIRANAIAPGFFVTAQNKDLLFDAAGNPTPRSGKILTATPMHRFGKVEELTGALLFLADDSASGFVTGTVLAVDGGFSAYSGV